VSKRGERRDIFSHLNAYDVLFVFLEEGRPRHLHRMREEGVLAFLHLACAQLIFAKILVFG